ncbi:MAG: DUF6798 domain-containing protein [Planctomycetaceae bacterium]
MIAAVAAPRGDDRCVCGGRCAGGVVDRARSKRDLDGQLPPVWCVVASVAASLFAFGYFQAPVPGVNEAHYLSKARFYWDPSWCVGDLFLESVAAHRVFYQLVGGLTLWCNLEQTAWVLRILGALLLAHGWVQMAQQFGGRGWAALWSAWLFLAQSVTISFSGEWIVGGTESKVFAYGLAFWALGSVGRRLWWRAAALAGLSISMHPVVGMWCLICGGSAILVLAARARPGRRTWPELAGGMAVLVGCALPGVFPAIGLALNSGNDPVVRTDADYVQVFYRLAHHLDPLRFPLRAYVIYGALLAGWIVWHRRNRLHFRDGPTSETASESAAHRTWNRRFLYGFVVASAVVAGCGLLLGLGPRPALEMPAFALRARLLRFYPFRVFDVILPIGWCLLLAELMSAAAVSRLRTLVPWAVSAACLVFSLAYPASSRDHDQMSAARRRDWEQVCAWVRTHTPQQALVLTPRDSFAFKWYAERAEFFSAKDCPQDAAGIIEWFRRSRQVTGWAAEARAQGHFDLESVRNFKVGSEIHYAIVDAPGDVGDRAVYANHRFRVYQLSGPR